jgi:hypothetical protein
VTLGQDVESELESRGCKCKRVVNGGDRLWYSTTTEVIVSVPDTVEPTEAANPIMEAAGMDKCF